MGKAKLSGFWEWLSKSGEDTNSDWVIEKLRKAFQAGQRVERKKQPDRFYLSCDKKKKKKRAD